MITIIYNKGGIYIQRIAILYILVTQGNLPITTTRVGYSDG